MPPSYIRVRAVVWAYGHGQTDRQTHRHTHRRAWPQYILRRLRLTQNVTSSIPLRWVTVLLRSSSHCLSVRLHSSIWMYSMNCNRLYTHQQNYSPSGHSSHQFKYRVYLFPADIISAVIDWVGFNVPTKHIIGHIGDGFYRSNDPTDSVKALKEVVVRRIGFNPTRSTLPCYNPKCYMYAIIHIQKWI